MSCVKQLTHVRVHIALMPTGRAVHRSIVGNRGSWFHTVSRRLRRPDQVRENTMLRTFLIGAVSALMIATLRRSVSGYISRSATGWSVALHT